jgi:aminobenzoyl-glutamate utilization protein B
MELVGPPRFWDEARDFARQIQSNLGLEINGKPVSRRQRAADAAGGIRDLLRGALPEWQTHYTSDDYVDYTWHAPTVRLLSMRSRLRPLSHDYEYPAWAHNALGGLPSAINPGILLGAKTIAATLLDLLTDRALLKQAQDEFRERTGGGIGGTKWVPPLLPRISSRLSICAGPNTSRPRAARNGGSRPRPSAPAPASRSDQRKGMAREKPWSVSSTPTARVSPRRRC